MFAFSHINETMLHYMRLAFERKLFLMPALFEVYAATVTVASASLHKDCRLCQMIRSTRHRSDR
jgi:hypothetical protein